MCIYAAWLYAHVYKTLHMQLRCMCNDSEDAENSYPTFIAK